MAEPTNNDGRALTGGYPAAGVWPHLKEVAVLLVAWCALFQFLGNSTLGYVNTGSLFGWWQWTMHGISDQDHAYVLPFFVVGLLYYRRDELAVLPKGLWWPGLIVVMAALGLHVLGYVIQQGRVSVVAFALGLFGLTGLFWGWRWMRASVLPFSLLTFCVPLGSGAEPLTFPLRLAATRITAVFCHAVLGVDVIQRGNQLLDAGGNYQYEVAAACSGIRSLTAILCVAIIYAFLSLRSPWRVGLLLLSAIPMAVVANVIRLVMIVVAAEAFGQAAGNRVHDSTIFGLLPYIPAIGGILLAGRCLRPRQAAEPNGSGLIEGKAQEA